MKRTDLVITKFGARFMGRNLPRSVGRTGITPDKREGDGATPTGTYRLDYIYYRADRLGRPAFKGTAIKIMPNDGWSDAPEDTNYNSPVKRPHNFSHEKLKRADPMYNIIGVLSHNRHPAIPGNGSAIFMHLWRSPRRGTEGCVAFDYKTLLWILSRWQPCTRIIIKA